MIVSTLEIKQRGKDADHDEDSTEKKKQQRSKNRMSLLLQWGK
jgi:hypothetical protein